MEKDFEGELNDYIQDSKGEEWTFDENLGVHVDHSRQLVMYQVQDEWICGDYNQFYSNRYIYDGHVQAWLDTITDEYSIYDELSCTFIPLTDDYYKGYPQGTNSIRLVVQSSPHYNTSEVVLIDENGITIGRDRSWDSRLRLPEMMVSKYHAQIFLDKSDKLFYIIDNGSQHGTFINQKRLSDQKQASLPYELRHLDIICIGSTTLEVHLHHQGWPCQSCLSNQFIQTFHDKKKKEQVRPQQLDLEETRREWIKNQKKLYKDTNIQDASYNDRAKFRRKNTKPEKFVTKDPPSVEEQEETTVTSYQTPVSGIGSKMLQKLGWQEGQGLGKHNEGIKEPVQPSHQSNKTGLGINSPPVNESKKEQQWRITQERYKNSTM